MKESIVLQATEHVFVVQRCI